ncbi:hypothetical protein [Microbacterium sp. MYb64]|uniref:hypothetical protein n=1 Tax=Microbacterium sp. MYb64 TaxID=1848691 RepID=UPI000CFC196F|nr:hypothetical protein [Microbacterium sp. MYb64]PRB01787.1 hypothetical protein CQ044_16705 [Microbacterium sp. MYb64]
MTVSPAVATILRDIIGLEQVDEENQLHVRLADAITNAGPGASFGARVVALRYVFNWALNAAGKEFGTAKANYEHFIAKTKTRLLAEPKMSVAKAEAMAEADDEAYRLKLEYLLAEQQERSMRKFLDTLESALDNHRTDRADQRAADRASAQGYGGGA